MSRAFVKEDTPDAPPFVPPRAALPDGVPNYVTPHGLRLLRDESDALEAERERLHAESFPADSLEETGRERELTVVSGRLRDLTLRIGRAQVVNPQKQDPNVVRFGAIVTVAKPDGSSRDFRIVGVDEADAAEGRIAFLSPVARALTGKRVGDTAEIAAPGSVEEVEVLAIQYV